MTDTNTTREIGRESGDDGASHDHPDGLGCAIEWDHGSLARTGQSWYEIEGVCQICDREFVKKLHDTYYLPKEQREGEEPEGNST